MKGNDKSRAVLNQRVADKRIAIKQYLICSVMCDNRDNAKLHQEMERQARDEMHHRWVAHLAYYFLGRYTGRLPAQAIKIWQKDMSIGQKYSALSSGKWVCRTIRPFRHKALQANSTTAGRNPAVARGPGN